MFNITPLVRTLLFVNIVVFILQQILTNVYTTTIQNQEVSLGLSQVLSLWSGVNPVSKELFKPYQFFTYMFAHGDFFHIFFNMITLISFAPILEHFWGEKKFLFFYLAAGIGAGVIYASVNLFLGLPGGPMLGASGAVYGLLMAFGLMFPDMELAILFFPIPIKAKYLVFIMGGITFLLDRSGSVAHVAHFGGAFVGFLIVQYWKSQNRGRY